MCIYIYIYVYIYIYILNHVEVILCSVLAPNEVRPWRYVEDGLITIIVNDTSLLLIPLSLSIHKIYICIYIYIYIHIDVRMYMVDDSTSGRSSRVVGGAAACGKLPSTSGLGLGFRV